MENNTEIIQTFPSKESLIEALVPWCTSHLDRTIDLFGTANALLSGGSTPGPAYVALNENYPQLDKVHFGLVDERFVSQESEYSNERLLRSCFSNAPTQNIHGMVLDATDAARNIALLSEKYDRFSQRTDLMILGMGPDGHTASLFPNDPASDEALKSDQDYLNTNAPAHPTLRITTSLSFICKAKEIVLIITGAKKLAVFQDKTLALPIHTLLEKRPDIYVYYTAL